ncbi:hypothetical protein BH11PAT3_BH11PAT3_1570 [soil metagenome]
MKSKATLMALTALLYSSTTGIVLAETTLSHENIINVEVGHESDVNTDTRTHTTLTTHADSEDHSMLDNDHDATSSDINDEIDSDNEDADGSHMSENHRSVVARFVHSLLDVANREGGIGSEVRLIAQSQNESASTTIHAMAEVEDRSKLHTFLVGSDHKNLEVIKTEISSTKENLRKLKTLFSEAKKDTDKVELNADINNLESDQVKVEAYVKAHEEVFSLFGWLNILFNK